jgi:hypothetical protein
MSLCDYLLNVSRRAETMAVFPFVCVPVLGRCAHSPSRCLVQSRCSVCSHWLWFHDYSRILHTQGKGCSWTGYKHDLQKEVYNQIEEFVIQNSCWKFQRPLLTREPRLWFRYVFNVSPKVCVLRAWSSVWSGGGTFKKWSLWGGN